MIGVILSGMLKDGSLGLNAIKGASGLAMVQCPDEALFKDMPQNAIEHDGVVDFVGPIDAPAEEICREVGVDMIGAAKPSGDGTSEAHPPIREGVMTSMHRSAKPQRDLD